MRYRYDLPAFALPCLALPDPGASRSLPLLQGHPRIQQGPIWGHIGYIGEDDAKESALNLLQAKENGDSDLPHEFHIKGCR
jgi:hypothetical protein